MVVIDDNDMSGISKHEFISQSSLSPIKPRYLNCNVNQQIVFPCSSGTSDRHVRWAEPRLPERREPEAHVRRYRRAHCSIAGRLIRSGMGARRIAETVAKLAGEMRMVAKTADVGDLAERLARAEQRAAAQQMCGMIRPKRIDLFAAGETTFGKKLLNVAHEIPVSAATSQGPKSRLGKPSLITPRISVNSLSDERDVDEESGGANRAPTRSSTAGCMQHLDGENTESLSASRIKLKSNFPARVSCLRRPPCSSNPRWKRTDFRGSRKLSHCVSPW
jgi:hypothetical protein